MCRSIMMVATCTVRCVTIASTPECFFEHTMSLIKATQSCAAGQHRAGNNTKAAGRRDNIAYCDLLSTLVVENGVQLAISRRPLFGCPIHDYNRNMPNIALWLILQLLIRNPY
jgi:hypothetical protein